MPIISPNIIVQKLMNNWLFNMINADFLKLHSWQENGQKPQNKNFHFISTIVMGKLILHWRSTCLSTFLNYCPQRKIFLLSAAVLKTWTKKVQLHWTYILGRWENGWMIKKRGGGLISIISKFEIRVKM